MEPMWRVRWRGLKDFGTGAIADEVKQLAEQDAIMQGEQV